MASTHDFRFSLRFACSAHRLNTVWRSLHSSGAFGHCAVSFDILETLSETERIPRNSREPVPERKLFCTFGGQRSWSGRSKPLSKGFQDSTSVDICRPASCNIHFQSAIRVPKDHPVALHAS